ncbi:MAG TPA: TIGR00730 family Rossman fold protein [Phycisphaerales bacterium]|nr:TIGR00730 family Rossman fold protein [Phycisphaerales bacterium]
MSDPANPIRTVAVYCSASNTVHPEYLALARRVGAMIASGGRAIVYGGGKVGLMGELARGGRDAGGRVIGVITTRLRDAEQLDEANHENIIVAAMRERKGIIESRGDALLVLPGGLGTMEEFFEVLTGRLLGEHDKPIIVLNAKDPVGGGHYYDPLLAMIRHMIELKFAKPGIMSLFEIASDENEVARMLAAHERRPEGVSPPDRAHMLPTSPGE